MKQAIEQTFNEETGYTVYRAGKFTYTVDGYHATEVLVHKDDAQNTALPIYVDAFMPAITVDRREFPYAAWEQVCDAAWKRACLQANA